MTARTLLIGVAATAVLALPAESQSLAKRIAAERNGAVTFEFASRPGVCGDGSTFIRFGHSYYGSSSSATPYRDCITGPVQVRLALHDGVADHVESWVGPARSHDARPLGVFSTTEATAYLLDVARQASGSAGSGAIFAAVLADSAVIWPQLLRIAHDDERSQSIRRDASHWLSRYAAGAMLGRANDPFTGDSDDDRDKLKDNAVFVLSQLHDDSRIPTLIDIARRNPDPHVRSTALFWLGQTGDPRALELFESLLRT
jgi:hypothetical protein